MNEDSPERSHADAAGGGGATVQASGGSPGAAEPESNGGSGRSMLDRLVHAIGGEPRDRNELLALIRDAQAREVVDAETLQMVEGVFQVIEMRVRDIMIPRGQMVVIEHEQPFDEILPLIIESGHSRFPVIDEDKDHVLGVILAKDLLRYTGHDNTTPFLIEDILRAPTFTPESKRVNVLLKEFRSARNHMALVLDEYGGVCGLVTIEDVLEEIVGEIDDEHDSADDVDIKAHGDGRFSVRALTPIDDFNETLGTDFADDEFDTIGGLLMQHFGHMPKPGESASVGGCVFRVLSADSRRLHLVQVTRSE